MTLTKDHTVCEKGSTLTPEQCRILVRLTVRRKEGRLWRHTCTGHTHPHTPTHKVHVFVHVYVRACVCLCVFALVVGYSTVNGWM